MKGVKKEGISSGEIKADKPENVKEENLKNDENNIPEVKVYDECN